MSKITVRDKDSGDVVQFEAPVTAETLAKAFSEIFDRSFEASVQDTNGKRRIEMRDKDSGQEWMSIRDIAIVLGRTRKRVYKIISREAKQTANILGVKPFPIRKLPGSKEYGALRSEFFAWLKTLPAPPRLDKGRKRRTSRHV